jgi:peptidoglycan/LPS O-acetylase OafA/YrhL
VVRRLPPLEAGQLASAAGAALLLVSLLLHWYEPDLSAWDVFETLDLVLALLGLAALAAAVGPRHEYRLDHRLLPLLGLAALVVVVSQLIDHPPPASGRGLAAGGWVGLVGALLLLAGGMVSRARAATEFAGERHPPEPRGPGADSNAAG